MFFERDKISFRLRGVMSLSQRNVSIYNKARPVHALSFRSRADTYLSCAKGEYHVTDGAVCLVPEGLAYSRRGAYDELIAIHLDVDDYHASDIESFSAADPVRMGELFSEALTLWQEKAVGYRHRCSAVVYQILALCYEQNCRAEANDGRLADAQAYIRAHYRDPDITVAAVAAHAYMSEVYLRKLFHAKLGISPRKYIISLRLRHAQGLIRTGYYSLREVAELSGYSDYKYFTSEFKRIMGMSPSEYAKQ